MFYEREKMKFNKALVVSLVAAGLYTYSSAVNYVSTLNDKEAQSIVETLSNPNIEPSFYICSVKSLPPPDSDPEKKV